MSKVLTFCKQCATPVVWAQRVRRFGARRELVCLVALSALLALLVHSAICAYSWFNFRESGAVYANWAGRIAVVQPATANVGEVTAKEVARAEFRILNVTYGTITLLGAQTPCGCAVVGELPQQLRSGESVSLPMVVYTHDVSEPTREEQKALLRFDVDGPPVLLRLAYQIVPGSAAGTR